MFARTVSSKLYLYNQIPYSYHAHYSILPICMLICGSIIQCVVKEPTFAPCHLLFYLTDVADDMNNMPCTLTKIDTMIVFALHVCLLCWHGNPVCGEAPRIMNNAKYFELTLYFLIWNWIEFTEQLSSLFIHVQNLSSLYFVSGWYAWSHAQVCWRLWDKPNIYCR